jgi:hypothetical protein
MYITILRPFPPSSPVIVDYRIYAHIIAVVINAAIV